MRSTLIGLLVALVPAAGCSPPAPSGGAGGGEVVAVVDGDEITLAELDAWIKDDLLEEELAGKSEAAAYEFRAERLDRMIDEQLLEAEAALRGVTTDELIEQEAAKVAVSEEEVTAFYEENKDRLGGLPLPQLEERIRRHLERRQLGSVVRALVAELRDRARVAVNLEVPRIEVAAVGPSRGPETAPITIVEFSDFQCPFCARSRPVVDAVLERYPQQVRVVYRHFPLESIHPRARAAAEASACAAEQERFWDYHDALFANQRKLGDEDLRRYAVDLDLDVEAFDACVAEERYEEAVSRDIADARRLGVTGTPAFFVNGRRLAGAQPVEEFVELIEAELAQTGGS